jgi:Ca2+-binding RTX toxin-like protein
MSVYMLLIIAGIFSVIITTPLNANAWKQVSVTNLKNLGNKIGNLQLPPTSVRFGNVITCSAVAPCFGTNRDDIIMSGAGEQVFALDGNDMIYGALNDQLYGGKGNDILLCGAGNCLSDGGPGDDVLTAGGGNNLLVGGDGNDKIFATAGDTVMSGGNGADHFDCPTVGRSMILDYNPSQGDTISGKCTLVNTVGTVPSNIPGINLPDTGNTGTASTVAPG